MIMCLLMLACICNKACFCCSLFGCSTNGVRRCFVRLTSSPPLSLPPYPQPSRWAWSTPSTAFARSTSTASAHRGKRNKRRRWIISGNSRLAEQHVWCLHLKNLPCIQWQNWWLTEQDLHDLYVLQRLGCFATASNFYIMFFMMPSFTESSQKISNEINLHVPRLML